ncbi:MULTISPECIES: aspartyl-phosphate phosphatase Spo0E family protein [Jeotgalibacillus]|uniref:aspartyl-phosphate phosphatase Spo0E family protein n=1 Tax=Jeotgalibacillus TaxID=157226 RepID=UPI00106D993C|nr:MULTISPECIES: aspartyl-phosphate phosphatase Spo0E family protein [Jeotgalibacillus]TFE03393.1 aspartyl-phosphate phosphatase Spo0E family protein [Jeotgalibacillus sp. R-1-5s-1]
MADQSKLLEEIEKKRQILIYTAAKEGLSSPRAVKYSQELDELLNQFEKEHSERPQPPRSTDIKIAANPG